MANLFLGLKYMIERDGKDKSSTYFTEVHHYGKVHLLENNAYLPLGFLAESELADVDFATSDGAFQFQNELFSAATGVADDVWHMLRGDCLTITPKGVTITDSNNTGYCKYKDTESHSNVTFSYIADRDGFMCIQLNLPKRNDYYISINGIELQKETISLPQMMAVGDVVAGDVIDIRIECDEGENSTMTLNAAILDGEVFLEGYRVLAASQLQLTRFESTRVEGIIECDRDGLLYASIPQNGNWKVYVDGQEAEIQLVGDCMIAVEIPQGGHMVSYRYHNSAFALGWKISLVCAAIFLATVQVVYKPDWKKILKK